MPVDPTTRQLATLLVAIGRAKTLEEIKQAAREHAALAAEYEREWVQVGRAQGFEEAVAELRKFTQIL